MLLKTTASIIAISVALSAKSAEAEAERVQFAIAAKPISEALQEFAAQTGFQVPLFADTASSVRTRPVSGDLAPEAALERMLDGTGLEYRLVDERTIAILERRRNANTEGSLRRGGLHLASAGQGTGQPRRIAQIAQAQTQTTQTEADVQTEASSELEEIVVTGSRLTGSNLTSPVPLVQVTNEDLDVRGTVRIEDMINVLPQATGGRNTDTDPRGNFTGTATVNLRDLEAKRTLVLVNGKRLPFGSPELAPANVDIVPAQLVERVDVVTGGGSALYGADAVAGVVNFILREDFEGIDFESQVSFRQTPGDGNQFLRDVLKASDIPIPGSSTHGRGVNVNFMMGANTADDKGNVTAYFGYENLNDFPSGTLANQRCTLGQSTGPASVNGIACTGSSNFRRFFTNDLPGTPENERLDLFQQSDGTLVPFQGTADQTFNFENSFTAQAKRERFNINAIGHYEVSDSVEFYGNLGFMNLSTQTRNSPAATFTEPLMTNCDNPLLADAPMGELGTPFDLFRCDEVLEAVANGEPNPVTGEIGSVDIPFRNSIRLAQGRGPLGIPLEGPNGALRRTANLNLTTWRVVVGFRGTIADHFDWDVFGQFARTTEDRRETNSLDFDRVQDALFVVENEAGEPVCRNSGTTGCAPFNIFDRNADGTTKLTDQALAFTTTTPGIFTGQTEQQVVGGTIQGDLGRYGWKSPAAQSGISLLLGVEYREDTLEATPDKALGVDGGPGSLIGAISFTPIPESRVEVVEGFMETNIPLVENAPFIESWNLTGAYRRSQYTVDGEINNIEEKNKFNTDTWFVGTTWSPSPSVRFRAQFQRAVRAPNAIELFTPVNPGGFDLSTGDPCAGPTPDATFEQCARTGVTSAQFGQIPVQPSGEFTAIVGGNPELEPEVADTVTAGVQFTPESLPGLSVAIDYFTIEIEKAISTVPPQETLQQCLEVGGPLCDLINRDQFGSLFIATGLTGIEATNVNIATIETSGVDFSIRYAMELEALGLDGWGSLNFDYSATWTTELETLPIPGGSIVDCQDKFGDQCSAPRPAYKHHFVTTWNAPIGLRFSTTWRRIGDTDGIGENLHPLDQSFPAEDYIDLSLDQQVTETVSFRIGVNNLFNTTPPFTTLEDSGDGAENGNTFPSVFDLDRQIFFGLKVQM